MHPNAGGIRVFYRLRVVNLAILMLATIATSTASKAQLIDTKDVSNISLGSGTIEPFRPTDSATGMLEKDCFIEHYDGFVKKTHPEKLRLEIINADTHFADDTTEITATVRIKNEGRWPILLPWQTDPVVQTKTADPNDKISYEEGALRLRFGTQENRARGVLLEGKVEFEALPHSYEQHIKLSQGQWVEVRFKALVKCWLPSDDDPLMCSEFKPDEHARLTAQYTEWRFTDQREGCNAVSSSEKARAIRSDPIEINFVPANPLGPSKK